MYHPSEGICLPFTEGVSFHYESIGTSMSLVIFCLLFSSVDYVPVKGEVIWYLSLTTWLISLSIMLCSSIHAVAKGKN